MSDKTDFQKQAVILIIDDNATNLGVIADLFERYNFEIMTARNGEKGIEKARIGNPDLILLDIMMPGINGFETCRRLKSQEHTRDIPVIFMTVLSETVNKVRGLSIGAIDYITKPFQAEEVIARVNIHLKIQWLQNELKEKNNLLADRTLHLEKLVEAKTRKIENLTHTLINALEDANYYNDKYTGDHIRRIGKCAAFIAEKAGCDRDYVKRIKLYSPLHDVGKVGLPDSLLKKSGKYTKEEFVAMQQHVIIGARMIDSRDLDPMVNKIVLYHHEKWDGSGYICRLSEETIPFSARIVTLVDVYDALLSKRTYKDAFPEEEANRIIRESSGSHLDPWLVEIFFRYQNELHQVRNS